MQPMHSAAVSRTSFVVTCFSQEAGNFPCSMGTDGARACPPLLQFLEETETRSTLR